MAFQALTPDIELEELRTKIKVLESKLTRLKSAMVLCTEILEEPQAIEPASLSLFECDPVSKPDNDQLVSSHVAKVLPFSNDIGGLQCRGPGRWEPVDNCN